MRLLELDDLARLPRDVLEQACRSAASPVYLGKQTALCRILGRYKLFVSTLDDGFSANVLLDGYWESWLTRFMARNVTRGGIAIDVGANYGYYSLLLADLVGPEGHLHAVEPNPMAASLLERSILLNGFAGRTTIHGLAVGAENGGTASLAIPEREPKNAAILADPGGWAGERHEVRIERLDSLVPSDRRIDFIKVDAEGAEEAIVAGMEGIFAVQRPPMVLEYNAARYADPDAFLQHLLRIYGSLRHVDYDGKAVAVEPRRVLSERFGEDWLLYFGAA